MNRLFVYGIFLSQGMRYQYGMTVIDYAVVPDYITTSKYGDIVEATRVNGVKAALTGLLVEVPEDKWEGLDQLEAGYDRVVVTTIMGDQAYMYAKPDNGQNTLER